MKTITWSLVCIVGVGAGCSKAGEQPSSAMSPSPDKQATAPASTAPVAKDPELDILTIFSVDVDTELARMCGLMGSRVFFKFDSATLRPDAKEVLDQIATCAVTGPAKGKSLRVIGRTDPRGTDRYNAELGKSRAASVETYLRGKGVVDERVDTISKGETDADTNPEGWPFDRRVTVRLGT